MTQLCRHCSWMNLGPHKWFHGWVDGSSSTPFPRTVVTITDGVAFMLIVTQIMGASSSAHAFKDTSLGEQISATCRMHRVSA